MQFVKIFVIALFCIGEMVILYFSFMGRKPIKILFVNALLGLGTLVILKLLEGFSGIFIPINQYTVVASATMGIPATLGILILRLIFL